MKHKRTIKPKKSDIIVPDIDEDDEDEEGLDVYEIDNFTTSVKTNKMLKKVQDNWVRDYLIN